MSRIFSTVIVPKYVDLALLILRIGAGGFMLSHGWPKFQNLISGNIQFAEVLGMSETLSLALAVLAEFICAILVVLGLATRLATIPLIITMAVAALVIHGDDPFGDKEASLHYLVSYLAIFIAGPGRYSIDHLISKK